MAVNKVMDSETPHRPPEWDRHLIFQGKPGNLQQCPGTNGSSPGAGAGWIRGSWSGAEPNAHGFMLPLSAQVQQWVWQHQHPPECATAKFLLYRDPGVDNLRHGIGSVLHIQTMALMMAINSGRILILLPGSYLAVDAAYCGNSTTLDSCYFAPLTQCQVTQQEAASAWKFASASEQEQDKFLSGPSDAFPRFASLEGYTVFFNKMARTAPRQFHALLRSTDIPQATWYYWWRAQGLAYIVRPNQRTLAELAVRKRDKLRGLPLAPGCVSVYIRHGDKGTEAQVYEDSRYEEALVKLRSIDPSLTRQVFLSTEDPASVVYFTNATRNWGTSWVDMPRKPDRNKSNVVYMKEFGFAESMLDGLLNLDLAMHCDGFVSGFRSNWARMIEELRSTVRCKAQAPYIEVATLEPTITDFME